MKHLVIIGGGAAGCFCGVLAKEYNPQLKVTLLEVSNKLLRKVALTGGGHCNLTNTFAYCKNLNEVYPRGSQIMKRVLYQWSAQDTIDWFEQKGVVCEEKENGRIFPKSMDAMEVVHTLENTLLKLGVNIIYNSQIKNLEKRENNMFYLYGNFGQIEANNVVIATGGMNMPLHFMDSLEINCEEAIPSLFAVRLEKHPLKELAGISLAGTQVQLCGTNIKISDSLLITHEGLSGPAILKLSSHGARFFHEKKYKAMLTINWVGLNEEEVGIWARERMSIDKNKILNNTPIPGIPSRLWKLLLERSCTDGTIKWAEIGKKQISKLRTILTNDTYQIIGSSKNKEEFVTCGGIATKEISANTMESKKHSGLYFAGEVTDIDGITGGFNLQAAWSTAAVVAQQMKE